MQGFDILALCRAGLSSLLGNKRTKLGDKTAWWQAGRAVVCAGDGLRVLLTLWGV